jgi:5-methyltetrahydrofolate--homocysteine methyltransferase
MTRQDRLNALAKAADARCLIIDGAMGTQLQGLKLEEKDFRGTRFADWPTPLKGNNDLLSLTKPDAVRGAHDAYLEIGADLVSTNTFSATSVAQADYGLEDLAPEIAAAAARLARESADAYSSPDKPRAVAGAVGPTNKTLSLSPDVSDPGFRAIDFDAMAQAYRDQVEAMLPFIDFVLIETIFDTLNAKAAIAATQEAIEAYGEDVPILISGTITDASGRTLSGQTPEAFWTSVKHAEPWAVGLNCALGAAEMRPHIAALSRVCNTRILAYPNAGLPNAFGEYDETPDQTAAHLAEWAESGLVNLVGGCCGTTPAHIAAIAAAVAKTPPRNVPQIETATRLSGLEPLAL